MAASLQKRICEKGINLNVPNVGVQPQGPQGITGWSYLLGGI